MNKVISNREFEAALANMDNKLIMESACVSFRQTIDRDELYRCKLIALWEAMIHWNPSGRKFTSFLYQKVSWECLKVLQKRKKRRLINITIDKQVKLETDLHEILECLPSDLQDILVKRYVYKMTLREIGDIYGFCHETIRRKIARAHNILQKNHYLDQNGV